MNMQYIYVCLNEYNLSTWESQVSRLNTRLFSTIYSNFSTIESTLLILLSCGMWNLIAYESKRNEINVLKRIYERCAKDSANKKSTSFKWVNNNIRHPTSDTSGS